MKINPKITTHRHLMGSQGNGTNSNFINSYCSDAFGILTVAIYMNPVIFLSLKKRCEALGACPRNEFLPA